MKSTLLFTTTIIVYFIGSTTALINSLFISKKSTMSPLSSSSSSRLPFVLFSSSIPITSSKDDSRIFDETETTATTTTTTTTTTTNTVTSFDLKDAVRVFGRLAEKYIMLDESGGMCCYSACKDCEYRLPDGGYRMADQRSSRPKWIPVYEERSFASNNNMEHTAKWKMGIFARQDDSGSDNFRPFVTKEEFVSAVLELEYVPPLGGPYVAASGGTLDDITIVEYLFDLLAGGKDKLSRHKMSLRLKEMANGEQGLTWPAFQAALVL